MPCIGVKWISGSRMDKLGPTLIPIKDTLLDNYHEMEIVPQNGWSWWQGYIVLI